MDKAEEKALILSLRRLEDRAWTVFYTEFHPALTHFVCLRFGCDSNQAEEIVQRTFVRCVRSIRTFDPERGRILGWLRAVASNEACTFLRRDPATSKDGSCSGLPPQALSAEIVECLDRQPLPEELLARQDTQALVAECLLELPLRQCQVLVMKYQEDLRVAEIARRLNLSEKAVESLLTRARESFRRLLVARAAARHLTVADLES